MWNAGILRADVVASSSLATGQSSLETSGTRARDAGADSACGTTRDAGGEWEELAPLDPQRRHRLNECEHVCEHAGRGARRAKGFEVKDST